MKYIAIIPARGGSKRIPGKNIKMFGEKPLIWYSINSARHCKHVDEVFVSTDDNDIASVAESFGAKVIIRPAELATDTATSSSALVHAFQEVRKKGHSPDAIITLQATNPLRKKGLIEDAVSTFEKQPAIDSLITVSENKHKLAKITDGLFRPFLYSLEQRSQDLEKLYYENGMLYITRASVLKEGSIFGKTIYPLITPEIYNNIDIDTIDDFELGQMILEKYKNELEY